MSALETSLVICAILVSGALTGALLRRLLPEHHLDNNAKDVVRLGCALIATISGLVLGLLINSAKTNFDTQRDEIRLLAANLVQLDWILEKYGVEAVPARADLRTAVTVLIDRIWGGVPARPGTQKTPFTSSAASETAFQTIRALSPQTEAQRLYQSQALQIANTMLQARLILFEQSSVRMPVPFLVVLVFWLFILFTSFSLFSPLNPTAVGAIVVFALSASGAIFLILEMYQPFGGLMQIDNDPLRHALAPLTS
jgi:hypothetical protein